MTTFAASTKLVHHYMIFYFSGTGNSLWVAGALREAFGESLISMADELAKGDGELEYTLGEKEKVFFVYPVHSWGPAVPVMRFVQRLRLLNYDGQSIHSVCTCGDECGYTTEILRKELENRGLRLTSSYSVIMPNNYILMPGFTVDSKAVEQQKLQDAPGRMEKIVESVRRHSGESFYHTGSLPFLKSRMIYPLFNRYALGKNSFYATDECIACGLCERICPTKSISESKTGKPRWAKTCVQCVACIHRCPVRAIEYGKQTQKKGRYYHPEINTL